MKTYSERLAEVTGKMRQFRRRKAQKRMAWTAAAAAVLTLVLFFPLNVEPPNVRAYSDSPYYELIKKIDQANGGEPGYKNLFTAITQEIAELKNPKKENTSTEIPVVPPEDNTQEVADDKYVNLNFEDDTLPGVTEGEVVLCTEKYIYRLAYNLLKVFSRDGAQSEKISEHRINAKMLYVDGKYEKYESFYFDTEMFLSADGTKITVMIPVVINEGGRREYTMLVQLDVSDPTNIRQIERYYVSGYPLDVWMVDDELLIVTEYEAGVVSDYSAIDTYVPTTGYAQQMQPIPAEDIVLTEDMTSLQYVVLYKVGTDTLQVNDQLAVITRGYYGGIYITEDYLFTAYNVIHTLGGSTYRYEGDIACFRYRDELEKVSNTTLSESVSASRMDLHNGVLRMITTQFSGPLGVYSLHCLNMPDLSVLSKTEDITPGGRPKEVQFMGDTLYFEKNEGYYDSNRPRTPYIFDLSDSEKVTFRQEEFCFNLKDRLVRWTDGYWLGICNGDDHTMTLELFAETEAGLCSVNRYEIGAGFASDKKNLYVDPERGLLGMIVEEVVSSNQWTEYCENQFLLLQFADGQWEEVTRKLVGQHRVLQLGEWIYLVHNDIRAIPIS